MTDPATDPPVESAWTKLRRRKVVQWGVAYAAGAWGFLQGVQFLAEAFEWPSRVLQLSTLAFVLGLPVVLVLAWYHGDRGEQRVTRVELAIVTLLFLIGGGLFWRYHGASAPQLATTTPTAASELAATIADPRPSIAVLPFDNRSRVEDDVFFVDGIHDDILTQLSKVSGMRVISRTSVEQFRDTKLPIKSIAEQLGVAQILEGGVQRAGDRVRVTVQLIDANTDAHLWAENYDRELTAANIFAIQSEVATAIAGALKATLTANEKASVDAVPTQNLEAWEAYQLGKQRTEKRTSAGLADAERFFRNAIELDPKFALAHAGLANTFRLQAIYSGRPRQTALSEAERVAAKALELDPNLAEAWAAMGGIANQRGRFQEGEKFLRRAIELNPNYATAHHWLSTGLADNGRFQDALESAEVAIQLDPLSAVINSWFGLALTTVGHFDEAAIRYHKTIEIDPSMPGSYENLAYLNASALNRFAEAVKIQEKAAALDTGGPSIPAQLAQYYQNLGDESQAIRLLNQALARWPDHAYVNEAAAYVFESLADRERAGRHARKTLAAEPGSNVALEVLRNSDLRKGDYAAARARYETASPELLASDVRVGVSNYYSAISLALVLQKMGDHEAAQMLLDRAEQTIRTLPRLGPAGHWIADVLIHALRGDKERALAALREAEQAGWRFGWRYYRDIDPGLASIRDDPEFKAVFADIERDMARQRAELAARPKDAPLALESH